MSATQLNSRLLSDPHWNEVSYLLSDESKLSVYYLEALWGDDGFRREWVRLREGFNAQWQGQVQELARCAKEGDMSLLQACAAGVVEGVSRLAKVYPLPFRVRLLLGFLLVGELLEPLGVPFALQCVGFFGLRPEPKHTKFFRLNTFRALYERLQLPPTLREYLPAQLGVLLVAWELAFQNVDMCPPLVGLPLPLRSESKKAYLVRVRKLLQADNLLLQEFVDRFYLKGSKFAFRNLRNAKGAVLALAEEYYEQCKVRASNRDEEILPRYARQVYLWVVKGETWGAIRDEVFREELDDLYKRFTARKITENEKERRREALRQRVIRSTAEACHLLGIPLPKNRKV